MNRAFRTSESILSGRGLKDDFGRPGLRPTNCFGLINEDQILIKPIVWRHPFIFYVGHLPAFTWNQTCGATAAVGSPSILISTICSVAASIRTLTLASVIGTPMFRRTWPESKKSIKISRPGSLGVLEALDAMPRLDSSDIMAQDGRAFEMVLEHEYMHQETLLYMMHELPLDKKNRPAKSPRYSFQTAARLLSQRKYQRAKFQLGAKFSELDFGWDNEFSQTVVDVPAFTMDSMPVTNGEYFEFVQSGAYDVSVTGDRKIGAGKYKRPESIPTFGFNGAASGCTKRCSISFRSPRCPVGRSM